MDVKNENYYISSELSEVVDLVLKRRRIELALGAGTDEILEEEFYRITTRLEKLVVKED